MAGTEERRAAVDARLIQVEADVKMAIHLASGVKRTADSLAKCTKVIIERFAICEAAWQVTMAEDDHDQRHV